MRGPGCSYSPLAHRPTDRSRRFGVMLLKRFTPACTNMVVHTIEATIPRRIAVRFLIGSPLMNLDADTRTFRQVFVLTLAPCRPRMEIMKAAGTHMKAILNLAPCERGKSASANAPKSRMSPTPPPESDWRSAGCHTGSHCFPRFQRLRSLRSLSEG